MKYRTGECFKTIEQLVEELHRLSRSHRLLEKIYEEMGPNGDNRLSKKLRTKIVQQFQTDEQVSLNDE